MEYPEEFSSQARARVETEKLKAGEGLEQYRNKTKARPRRQQMSGPYGTLWTDEEEDLHEYILRVVLAYGHEACEVGLQTCWTVDRIRSDVVEFRRKFTIEAYHQKGYDKLGHQLSAMVSNWGGSLLPDIERTFQESIEWHQFEEELLAVAERQAAQNSQPGGPAKSISEIRAKFLQGVLEYPDLLAHWESRQDLWTLLDAPTGEVMTPADPRPERLFKETARIAAGLLGNSREPAWHTWLDLMRKEKRGFRRMTKARSWHEFQVLMDSVVPAAGILLEDGTIGHLFKESAEFCEDLGARTHESEKANLGDCMTADDNPDTAPGASTPAQAREWADIEISFLSDERVQILNGSNTETRNYGELGFADRRNGKPNQAWVALRALAEAGGIIRDAAKTGGKWPKAEKRMQEIRKALRNHFGIATDPVPFVEGTGYRALFKISCSPSYDT